MRAGEASHTALQEGKGGRDEPRVGSTEEGLDALRELKRAEAEPKQKPIPGYPWRLQGQEDMQELHLR